MAERGRRASIPVVSLHRALPIAAAIVGVALIVVAVVYWVEPAGSLPGFFPGHSAGSDEHHVKHGIAALVVGLALLAFAWFRSAPGASRRDRSP